MKTLIVVRHAKSTEAEPGQKDFDRPLSKRGKIDAAAMGRTLYGQSIKIDLFISSPAKRAKKTCKCFVKEYNRDKNEIVLAERLYNAPSSAYYSVISAVSPDIDSVAIFGHNPGITDFVNTFSAGTGYYEMPTCGAFAVEAEIDDWKDFEKAEKRFLFFEIPKLGEVG